MIGCMNLSVNKYIGKENKKPEDNNHERIVVFRLVEAELSAPTFLSLFS